MMAISRWLLVLLTAMAIRAAAQQEAAPSLQDGPLQIPSAKPGSTAQPQLANPGPDGSRTGPDSDGVYEPGPGIEMPRLIDAAPVMYPPDAPLAAPPRICVVSAVVGVDGAPTQVKVFRSLIPEVDQVLLNVVSKSHFEPGTLDGKPVPVRINVGLHFFSNGDSAIPKVSRRQFPGVGNPKAYDVPPKPIHTVEAEFSDQARRAGKSGSVTVSLVVDTDGMPTQIRVVRGAGYGLDEKAIDAVSQYRFEPAMKDGKPVIAPISVQVLFRLYSHPN